MNWSDLSTLIGKSAPLIGGLIGGPAGASVGSLIASGLGVNNTPEAVAEAITKDPESAVKLKQIEADNKESLRQFLTDTLQAELRDKQNAREQHKHNPMPAIICVALTVLVGAGAGLLFTLPIPGPNKSTAYLLFGTLLAKWGDAIAYWVGTTRSSAEKNRSLFK